MPDVAVDLATPTDLVSADALGVADALNGALADAFALYLKTKSFHWHMSGSHFRTARPKQKSWQQIGVLRLALDL